MNLNEIALVFAGMALGLMFIIVFINPDEFWHDKLVKAGHAQYTTTGVWELKECK